MSHTKTFKVHVNTINKTLHIIKHNKHVFILFALLFSCTDELSEYKVPRNGACPEDYDSVMAKEVSDQNCLKEPETVICILRSENEGSSILAAGFAKRRSDGKVFFFNLIDKIDPERWERSVSGDYPSQPCSN